MICLQVDDLSAAKARAEAMGIRVVLNIEGLRAGDQRVSAVHLHPADTGGSLFSFEEADPPESWAYAGEAWPYYRRGEVVRDIVGVGLTSPDPDALGARLARLLNRPISDGVINLDNGRIEIGRNTGRLHDEFDRIDFATTDAARVGEVHVIAGTTLRFV